MEIARYEKRVIAYFIDLMVAFLPCLAIGINIYLDVPLTQNIPIYFYVLGVQFATYILFVLLSIFFVMVSNGYTLGALIFGIRAVHLDRSRITFRDAIIRSITIGVLPMVLVNAIYMITIHTERTIFDRITETVVVDYRRRG